MSKLIEYLKLDLQLFADGGDAGGGTGDSGTNGVSAGVPSLQSGAKNPLADVQYGIQEQTSQAADAIADDVPIDRNAEFEKLIKGDYKDLYDARVQDTVQRRLKSTKDTVDKYNALTPTLELLSRKYGVDANDVEALTKAIEEDDAYYEDEALEKGVTVEQLKAIRKMEKENADLKAQMRERDVQQNADRIYADWMNQSEALKSIYPNFNLNAELQNPKFADLIQKNVDVRTAYEVIHKDEIIPAAMQFAVNETQRKVTNSIMANGARPVENGISSQSSAVVKSDVSQLSREDRAEIIRRVARGERIRF